MSTVFTDEADNSVYVELSNRPVARTVEVQDGINVDLDIEGRPVGVEWITPSPEALMHGDWEAAAAHIAASLIS